MKKIMVLLLVLSVFLAACQPAAEKKADTGAESGMDAAKAGEPVKKEIIVDKSQIKFKIDNETKEKIEIQQKEDGVEIEGVEPTMEALATSKGTEWCKAGEQWKFSTAHEGIDASAQWEIQGIIESGEYAGLCHVVSTAQSPLGETKMDYYFAEDGESGYFEMKMPDGKVIKQEWTG